MGKFLDDSEREFFDCVANELNELSGTEVNFYGNNAPKGKKDPVYGEYTERKIEGPWRLWGIAKWPEVTPEAGETGFGREFDGMCSIARVAFDQKNAPYPSEGDIVEMWRTPYHDARSMGKGLFFDVVKIDNDGHIHDTPSFVNFKLYLKRRTQFGAERKL